MKKRHISLCILLLSLLIVILYIFYNSDNYEYMNTGLPKSVDPIENNRCIGGSQDGATCENIDAECYNILDSDGVPLVARGSGVKCLPYIGKDGIDGKHYCLFPNNEIVQKPTDSGEEDSVEEDFECNPPTTQEEYLDCPGGICESCSINELDGNCGKFNNGCGFPCINGTTLDRSSNGSTEYIEMWDKEECSNHEGEELCEGDGCNWIKGKLCVESTGENCDLIDGECPDGCSYNYICSGENRPKFKTIPLSEREKDEYGGIPTQVGCCSQIKQCGIGEPGSETDPCYPNGECVRCSYEPLSWAPQLEITRTTNNTVIAVKGNEEDISMVEGNLLNYSFNIKNGRNNDIIYLIPYVNKPDCDGVEDKGKGRCIRAVAPRLYEGDEFVGSWINSAYGNEWGDNRKCAVGGVNVCIDNSPITNDTAWCDTPWICPDGDESGSGYIIPYEFFDQVKEANNGDRAMYNGETGFGKSRKYIFDYMNDNKEINLTYILDQNDLIFERIDGFIIQLIRVNEYIDGISIGSSSFEGQYARPYMGKGSIFQDRNILSYDKPVNPENPENLDENQHSRPYSFKIPSELNDIGLNEETIGLAGVQEWIIPNVMIDSDIERLIGRISKRQDINERICSGEFGGLTETLGPTENYQCICNDGYISNLNLSDWMAPYGEPIISLSDEATQEEIEEINIKLNKFYRIFSDNNEINKIIVDQMRNINNWEKRNKCRILDESVQEQGSLISRVSQDYGEINKLWSEGDWNPEQMAGGEHIDSANYVDTPTL